MADVDAKPRRRRQWLWIIGGLALLAILSSTAILSSKAQKPAPQTAATDVLPSVVKMPDLPRAEVAHRAIASVTRQPAWEDIILYNAWPEGYVIDLRYKTATPPPTPAVVERDATTIMRAVEETARAAGYQPEDFYVYVTAGMVGKEDATGMVSGGFSLGFLSYQYYRSHDLFDFNGAQVPLPPYVALDELARRAVASVTRQPAWEEIVVVDATEQSYIFDLRYKEATPPPTPAVVDRDTTTIARALVKTVRAAGYDPKNLLTGTVAVFAHMRIEKDATTGKPSILPLGQTRYVGADDSFVFDPPCQVKAP
jgi:hypothetical protein